MEAKIVGIVYARNHSVVFFDRYHFFNNLMVRNILCDNFSEQLALTNGMTYFLLRM
jgi:hypothetical protein